MNALWHCPSHVNGLVLVQRHLTLCSDAEIRNLKALNPACYTYKILFHFLKSFFFQITSEKDLISISGVRRMAFVIYLKVVRSQTNDHEVDKKNINQNFPIKSTR